MMASSFEQIEVSVPSELDCETVFWHWLVEFNKSIQDSR